MPRTQSLIDEKLATLDDDYCLIKVEVNRLSPRPKNPRIRYTDMTSHYRDAAVLAMILRLVFDILIKSIELLTPVAVFIVLVAVGGPPLQTLIVAGALIILFVYPYLSASGHEGSKSRAWFLALFAVSAYAVLDVLAGAEHPAITVSTMASPEAVGVIELAVLMLFVVATVGLVATLLTHGLRRQRRNLHGWFLPQSPREEIVCELVQVLSLLGDLSGNKPDGNPRKALAMEKLDRVARLFWTGAVYAAQDVSGGEKRAARKRCRRIGFMLNARRDRVGTHGQPTWKAMQPDLAKLAAGLLVTYDEDLHTKGEQERLAKQERLRAVAIKALSVVTVVAIAVGLLLFLWYRGPLDSHVLTALVTGVLLGIVRRVARQVEPGVAERFFGDQSLRDLVNQFIRERRPSGAGDGPTETSAEPAEPAVERTMPAGRTDD